MTQHDLVRVQRRMRVDDAGPVRAIRGRQQLHGQGLAAGGRAVEVQRSGQMQTRPRGDGSAAWEGRGCLDDPLGGFVQDGSGRHHPAVSARTPQRRARLASRWSTDPGAINLDRQRQERSLARRGRDQSRFHERVLGHLHGHDPAAARVPLHGVIHRLGGESTPVVGFFARTQPETCSQRHHAAASHPSGEAESLAACTPCPTRC